MAGLPDGRRSTKGSNSSRKPHFKMIPHAAREPSSLQDSKYRATRQLCPRLIALQSDPSALAAHELYNPELLAFPIPFPASAPPPPPRRRWSFIDTRAKITSSAVRAAYACVRAVAVRIYVYCMYVKGADRRPVCENGRSGHFLNLLFFQL